MSERSRSVDVLVRGRRALTKSLAIGTALALSAAVITPGIGRAQEVDQSNPLEHTVSYNSSSSSVLTERFCRRDSKGQIETTILLTLALDPVPRGEIQVTFSPGNAREEVVTRTPQSLKDDATVKFSGVSLEGVTDWSLSEGGVDDLLGSVPSCKPSDLK